MTLLSPRRNRLVIVCLFILNPLSALAQTTHVVQVGDYFFDPKHITIQAGDTVRWENPGSENFHSVLADDFSFSSGGVSAFFTFEHTFTKGGVIAYHCPPHWTQHDMEGTVTVQGTIDPPFDINAGLNDSWFNPATSGQGFFITVFPDISSIFIAWFTYDTERPDPGSMATLGEPGHRWLTAFGEYAGDTAMLEVELTEGGVFNAGQPGVTQTADGTIVLECTGCNECTVTYDITSAGVQGVIPIERIALDNVPTCEELAAN